MNHLFISVIILAIALVLHALLIDNGKPKQTRNTTCSVDTCGALADVNNPAYNMKETIKNTLLIEDHLSDSKKYCKSCLVKHFLLNLAYLSEGIWMACNHCEDYPKLKDSEKFWNDTFDKWYKNMDDEQVRLKCLAEIRAWRQEMIKVYYFEK